MIVFYFHEEQLTIISFSGFIVFSSDFYDFSSNKCTDCERAPLVRRAVYVKCE